MSLCMIVMLFIATSALAKINTDTWQTEFLAITLAIIVLININSAIFQGGIFGLAGAFPPQYMKTLLSGQVHIVLNYIDSARHLFINTKGGGGVVVATINIILLAIGGDQVDAAFYCFLFSVFYLIGSVFAFLYLSRTSLYHQCIVATLDDEADERTRLLGDQEQPLEKTVDVLAILKKIKTEAVTVFLIYVVTLGLFPAVTVLIQPTNIESGGVWETKYFVPVTCFLFYNIGDYIGRLLVETSLSPKICSQLALALSVLRTVFIPLLLMCNIAPDQRSYMPVYLDSDAAYIILIFLLSLSNGYLTSIVMVNAPARVLPYEQQTSSNLMVGLLGLGLISGAVFSAILVKCL